MRRGQDVGTVSFIADTNLLPQHQSDYSYHTVENHKSSVLIFHLNINGIYRADLPISVAAWSKA
jgi:hypothetical protein